MDMRVPLDNEGIPTLVADRMQSVAFPDHVNLITRPVKELASPESTTCETGAADLIMSSCLIVSNGGHQD